MIKKISPFAAAMLLATNYGLAAPAQLNDWPHVTSAISKNPELEARIAQIVANMSLAQKIGQMTQPEIKTITPAQVSEYYIGSVLNGGGSWPNGNKYATAQEWLTLADNYYDASMATDMAVKIPVIWGIDAIHGNSNVYGATLFPQNIGLGAAHDPKLIRQIGTAVGKAVRATGINWVFAPTLAVVQDSRWGRTYESFSQEGGLVRSYGFAYVKGLQGNFDNDANVVGTAKHFIGDGGTDQGKDQGITKSNTAQMINIHAQGYIGAFSAGVQTVMASYNSWDDVTGGVDYGKMHGSQALLTGVLKTKMGFDGLVVSDWNGIGQIPGCNNASCPQAINAGIDLIMVPDDWKAFIANTIAQVQNGQIPMARIDDAVTRILRVKMRAGLFGKKPSANRYAGKQTALQANELAQRAVRKSLVLLKNNNHVLPLAHNAKILVIGKSADSMSNQTGGWSLTWQGTDNKNSDFPNGQTILAGIQATIGAANVTYSADAHDVDVSRFDAVIAILGETPYAEGAGDIGAGSTLRHSTRYPEDLAALQAVAGAHVPVVSVLLSGRPLYVNDLLNLSDSFVAAWLPGTEGRGVADVLFRNAAGKVNHDFSGTLTFEWPKSACPSQLGNDKAHDQALFGLGYGMRYTSLSVVPHLDEDLPAGLCGVTTALPVFNQADRATYPLFVTSGTQRVALGADLNAVFSLPTLKVETAQVNTQQDGKLVIWNGEGSIEAHGVKTTAIPAYALNDGALQFDTVISVAPEGAVTVAMECGSGCTGAIDVTATFTKLANKERQTVKIPLACFAARGVNLSQIDTPFKVSANARLAAAFANIQIVGGAANDADALHCAEIK